VSLVESDRDLIVQNAIGPVPRLIVFAGHAGAGKTTLAKRAMPLIMARTGQVFFFLDKDTAYGRYSAQVLALTTGNPDDRDSPFYVKNLRGLEYAGLIDIVRENLELNVNVVAVGPFSQEIRSGLLFDPVAMGLPVDVHTRMAWIDLPADEARRRMVRRADPRDTWKLKHWEEYARRRIVPPAHPLIRRFDNSTFDEAEFDALITHLVS
jgi:energy-coupling factor transporter ATP-binding protein EcfA2